MPQPPEQSGDPPEEFATERWRYAGRRQSSDGKKLLGSYVDDAGSVWLFSSKHRAVGATYELEVCRRSDGGCTVKFGTLTYVQAPDQDDPKVREWIAEDRAAYAADELRKAENYAKRDDGFGSLTLNELRDRIRHAPAGRRYGLLAQITRYVLT
ncbi:MAG: hypothetical protein JHD16_00260 [Solirubrobacteraceae bacterium]|nr:hypothetical protein [Solirubrobacteraceae bacterium]